VSEIYFFKIEIHCKQQATDQAKTKYPNRF